MSNVKIIVDSACDIPKNLAKEYEIEVIGMPIIIEGKIYKDFYDFDCDNYYDILNKQKEIPTTSQISYEDYYNSFENAVKEGNSVICITLSSKGSGTFNTANLAKGNIIEKYKDASIHIIDSMFYTLPYALGAIKARQMLSEGMSIEETVERVTDFLYKSRVQVLVKSLDHLNKGGRINKASFVIGSMLNLNPVLTVKNGIMDKDGMIRGSKKLNEKLLDKILDKDEFDRENPGMYICHGDDEENALSFKKLAEEKMGYKDIPIYKLGATIATHIGPGVLAIFYNAVNRIDE